MGLNKLCAVCVSLSTFTLCNFFQMGMTCGEAISSQEKPSTGEMMVEVLLQLLIDKCCIDINLSSSLQPSYIAAYG